MSGSSAATQPITAALLYPAGSGINGLDLAISPDRFLPSSSLFLVIHLLSCRFCTYHLLDFHRDKEPPVLPEFLRIPQVVPV